MGALVGWAGALIERRWKLVVLLTWLGFCGHCIIAHRADIGRFNLSDSDDNMRLMQVLDLLNGQGWFDLRQYRVNPPIGANIHWSRIVDLPIGGLIIVLRPFVGNWNAERISVAIAPLIPLLPLLFAITIIARRLIHPKAYPLVFVALYFAAATNEMFMPERIDHHGWQLALLAVSLSAITDPKAVRGGLILGISAALSLAIGLEMMIYLAIVGAALAVFWVADSAEKERLRAAVLSFGGAIAICFLLFTSYDNRDPVCDALSPVWLSDGILCAALLFALTSVRTASAQTRLLLTAGASAVAVIFHATSWPQCVGDLQTISPEAKRLWFTTIREVQPLYERSQDRWQVAVLFAILPVVGLGGWCVLTWMRRHDPRRLRSVLTIAVLTLSATLLMFWQSRTVAAAQMLATIGCGALTWFFVPKLWRLHHDVIGVFGAIAIILLGSGAEAQIAVSLFPPQPTWDEIAAAPGDAACPSVSAMQMLNSQKRGRVITFVEYGPRLITLTHHDAIAAPYHRNYPQIVDVMKFWEGPESQAHAIARKYQAAYILSCPASSSGQLFEREAPDGFYEQLQRQQVPAWLVPISLPDSSPFKMWKVVS